MTSFGLVDPPTPRQPRGEGRFWLSPGAALGLSMVACVIALGVIFLLVPFYTDRADRRQEERRVAAAKVLQRRQTAQFLHRYDCTYGQAIRITISEASRSAGRSAHLALQGRHAALLRNDRKSAHRQLLSYRNSSLASKRYGEIAASLRPLGRDLNGQPFPPCS